MQPHNGVSAPFPPGLDSPLLYMGAMFFMLLGVLLMLEWIWRLCWRFFERPAPLRSPETLVRSVLLVLLVAGVVRVAPRLWLFMKWPTLSPASRADLYAIAAYGEIAAVALFTGAWLVGSLAEPMVTYQLGRRPVPLHLWPTWEQLKRPLKIGAGVFAISFALTYLR